MRLLSSQGLWFRDLGFRFFLSDLFSRARGLGFRDLGVRV